MTCVLVKLSFAFFPSNLNLNLNHEKINWWELPYAPACLRLFLRYRLFRWFLNFPKARRSLLTYSTVQTIAWRREHRLLPANSLKKGEINVAWWYVIQKILHKFGNNEFPASGSVLTNFFVGVFFCRFHRYADIVQFVVRCLIENLTKWQVYLGGCVTSVLRWVCD